MIKPIAVERWAEGSPERAYAEYVRAWQKRDFDEMINCCQQSWVADNANNDVDPTEILRLHSSLDVTEIVYIDPTHIDDHNADVVIDLTACVRLKNNGKQSVVVFYPRLVKESAPYTADAAGTWGVNPIAALRKR